MHAPASPPKPDLKEKVFEIRDLTGKVVETRPTYWTALMRGYLTLRNGNFTIEERR